MFKEKTWVRLAFGVSSVLSLAALTVAASAPPNLAKTLAAQQELAADRPYDAEVHNDHGNLLMLAGRAEEAEQAYRRAIEVSPDATLARFNLGTLLQQAGRRKDARAEFERILEIEPHHARAHYQLGMLFHSRNQRSKAVKHYARAFAFDPELTFPRTNPHFLDNDLATEALLASRRFSEDLGTEAPQLYGDPDRIAELMLETEESAAEEEPEADAETEGAAEVGGRPVERAARAPEDEEEDGDEGDDEDSDEEDDEGSGEDRRTLTPQDLDVGSSLGQVGGTASGRRPSAGRSSQGRDARTRARRPRTEAAGGEGETDASGRGQRRPAPRYRPASRLSTGRLELKLLPPETSPLESLAQLEALDQQGRGPHHAAADG